MPFQARLARLSGYLPVDSEGVRSSSGSAVGLLRAVFPGGEILQQQPRSVVRRFVRDPDGAIRRLTRGRLDAWLRNAARAGGCSHPVRLAGHHTIADKATGEVVEHFDTADLPDGVLYRPCGSRRESQCPACAKVYRYDAHQLIRAGLAGGKGVSSAVSHHPAVFATFTAPSFGFVHSRVVRHHGCRRHGDCSCVAQPCRARRNKPLCPHGKPAYCAARHSPEDSRLGRPLCADCYDYDAHVVWNHFSGKLWSRTVDRLRRYTTTAGAKIRYAKVAEVQRRGAVHFHAIIRLDGDNKDSIISPPEWFTTDALTGLLRDATAETTVGTPTHPDKPGGWDITWGSQLDVQPLRRGVGDDQLTERYVRYLAKYSTKSTESAGLNIRRLTAVTVGRYTTPSHVGRLVAACWRLGRPLPLAWREAQSEDVKARRRWVCQNGHPPRRTRLRHCTACGSSKDAAPPPAKKLGNYQRLRHWAHTLGFGGHFLTKSQRYSTTFGALRAARTNHHRSTLLDGNNDLVVLRQWTYRGSGWETPADAELALQAADSARARTSFLSSAM